MWSLGTILGELLEHTPLFTGATDIDQLSKISKFIGQPTKLPKEAQWFTLNSANTAPVVDWHTFFSHRVAQSEVLASQAIDLVSQLLVYDEDARLSTA